MDLELGLCNMVLYIGICFDWLNWDLQCILYVFDLDAYSKNRFIISIIQPKQN